MKGAAIFWRHHVWIVDSFWNLAHRFILIYPKATNLRRVVLLMFSFNWFAKQKLI